MGQSFFRSLSRMFFMICMVFATVVGSAFASDLEKAWLGKPVFNKVGLRAEWKKEIYQSYSTNYVGVSDIFPVNTEFVVKEIDKNKIVLEVVEKKKPLSIEFVAKHNAITLEEYLSRTFSASKVSFPSSLTKTEVAQIGRGDYAVGMSREALFLSIGYPPATLNPDFKAASLRYQKKRFNTMVFHFEGDKVSKVED